MRRVAACSGLAKCNAAKLTPARSREKHEFVSKMKFSREINQLFDTFCRTWKSGAKAKLNLSAESPVVKAALELDLRKLDEAPPGVSVATGGLLGTKARCVRQHR